VLLGTPIAHALRLRFPRAHISWYAHPMAKLILTGHPWVDELLVYPVAKKAKPGEVQGLRASVRAFLDLMRAELAFALALRRARFDVVVDAMCNPRTALNARLTGAPLRISFRARFPRTLAFNELVPQSLLAEGYVAAARLHLLAPLGIDAQSASCETLLVATAEEEWNVKNWMNDQGVREGCYLVVAAAHRHSVRKWEGAKFVALAERLFSRRGLATVWLWGPGEDAEMRALHNDLIARCGACSSHLPPLLTLRETAFLAGRSACFVGNSNGLSHVSVAGGARSVQLHGPTTPENWTHPDTSRHRGVQRGVGCVRCEKNTCALARRECLDDLSVEDVERALEEVLPK